MSFLSPVNKKRVVGLAATLVSLVLLVALPLVAGAQEFVSLSGIEGIEPGGDGAGLQSTFNTIYVIVVAIGVVFAVVKIAIAGTRYMLSDVVTDKSAAKKDIEGAILGLIIILATYLVLYTIYPGLVDLNVLETASIDGVENISNVISTQEGVPSCRTC